MKVLFLINSLKSKSGSERVAIELANKMVSLECYNVTIINRESIHSNCAYIVNDHVNVIALSGSFLNFYKKLKQHLKDNNYEKIIIHNMGKLTLLCTLLPLNDRKKIVSLEHVSFVSRPKLVQILSEFCYKKIQQVVTLTANDGKQFKRIHKNVEVIPNFSPFEISTASKILTKNIVTLGRLTDQKNYIHLLKAWELIATELPEWTLNIYGEGEQKELLKAYIEEHSLLNVYLRGVTSDVKEVYLNSDFFVMSSKYEGLPMVLIEAQSFGLPIVSYDCPFGPSDVIEDRYNGILVEDQNINMLASSILELAQSGDLLIKYSENSKINAEKYQADQILQLWHDRVLEG